MAIKPIVVGTDGSGFSLRAVDGAAREAVPRDVPLWIVSVCARRNPPELIALDDWGFPLIDRDDVPEDLLEEAREARRLCPRLALRLETRAG